MRKLNFVWMVIFFLAVLYGCAVENNQGLLVSPRVLADQENEKKIQEQIEKEERARIRAEKAAQARKNAIYPMQFEMIATGSEKKGLYTITLVFQPGEKPLSEFEQELRNDFAGEIEILYRGEHYKTIYYEDFTGFIPAPVGTGYGPTYSVYMERGNYNFYPRIRGKKPCSYSLAIKRQQQGLGERLKGWLRAEPEETQTANSREPRSELQVPARLERFDLFADVTKSYGMSLGIRKKGRELDDDTYFYRAVRSTSAGTIDILRNDKPLKKINYTDSTAHAWVGWGTLFDGAYYDIFGKEGEVWYSFIPKYMQYKQIDLLQ